MTVQQSKIWQIKCNIYLSNTHPHFENIALFFSDFDLFIFQIDYTFQATMMSGSTLSFGDESEVCNDGELKPPALELKQCWDCCTETELNDSNTTVPLELHKV